MSLTQCLRKAGDALRPEDKAEILAAAAKYRKAGMGADEAGRKAVDEQIAKVQAMLEAPAEVAAPAPEPEPAAPAVEQPEAETDAIDQRIAEAELAGVELSDDDKDKIRAALTKAEELNRKAGRISGLASDPMRKGNAFPMGVGFTRMTKRAEQRIDASVKRAGEAVEVFKRAEQAERYAEALLAGNGTDADKIRKEEVRTETRRVLLDKLLNWKKGDKIGAYTIERVSNDAEGYPSSYTISGDGIIKGVSDKVQVAREFFDGDKEALRAMVDEIRGPTAAAPAEAEKPTPADKPASKTPLVDAHLELFKGVRAGTATPDDFKAMYRRFRDEKAAVVAELNTSTKDQLLQDISGYVRPGTTKGDLVEMIYNGMLSRFALGKDYGPRWMTMGEEKAYEKATRDALDALVEGQTAESLAEYAAAAKAEFDAEVAKRTALMESVKDPKTLQDFRNYMRLKTSEGMDYQEARLTLTPEQRATMDELAATETRSRRTSAKEEQRTQVRVAGQMVDGGIIATKHTKKGHDLYVVRLSERVSTEDYKTLLEGAKRIGGYYSSYRGGGAIPGFQFAERSQAEAFVKLAGGDNTAAQEAAKERRNAYDDDRSQSAAERLVEMAEKMEEDADESLGRDRKANTERRARFAASAEAGARNLQAMAKTMRNVAQALTAGKAKFLDRIRTRTQIELLQTYVANAKGDQLRAKYPTYAEQEKRRGEPPDVETADYAEFPSYTAYRSDLASLGRQLLEVDGTKKLGERLMKVADDVSDAFTAWAKEPGNLFRLSTFSVRSGEDVKTAIFKDRETAERAIKRSGLSGKAIVFPEKRGVNRVIMSPSEAIAKGIWTGDGDKRITLSDEFGSELVEGIGRAAKRQAKDRMNARAAATPWQFERAYERRKQLQRMGLETPAEFRSALREFIGLREQAIEADRVKMLERAMVGKAKDGLDFFPTPESVADEMIAAADIKPDMAVLEPSAGMGHIADRIRAAGAEPDVIEMANDRRELLQEKGYHLQPYYDFLQMEPRKFFTYGDVFRAPDGKEGTLRGLGGMGSQRVRLEDEAGNRIGYYNRDEVEGVRLRGTQSGYDRIIMNPPFSNGRDIDHVRHAYTLLKPGGRIVAIMGESAFTNQNKKATEFREWLDSVGGTEEKLPAGTFNDPSLPVNTGANARMVVIDRSESDTPFSRASTGRGIPESDARNLASILRAALPKAPPIIIHDSVDKAPQSLRDAIYAEGAERDVEAAYHEGEIHVFPGHIESAERFNFVVGHHEMRHYGIRGILGQQYKQVLTGIAMRNPTLRAAARAKQDAGLAKDLATGVDEALADMPVEEIAALSGIDRLVSRIRQWLRETAAKLREYKLFALADAIDPKEWTDNDVAHFVWKVEDFARRGGSPMSTGGTMFSGPAQTDTEAFRKWFGDSKVVDERGEPLVVYHGTPKGEVQFEERDRGIFFTSNHKLAGDYTRQRGAWISPGKSPAVYPAYLSMQNPLLIDAAGKRNDNIPVPWQPWKPKVFGNLPANAVNVERALAYARENGHDGLIVRNVNDAATADETRVGDVYAVLRPEQIKSATGNRGTFDPENSDIRFSRAPGLNMTRAAVTKAARNTLHDMLADAGKKVTWWDKSVGTQYAKARKFRSFGIVFDKVQEYIEDTSTLATQAADMAPDILPKLEKWSDFKKMGISAKDAEAVAAPIFEGTLSNERYDEATLRSRFGLNDRQVNAYGEFYRAVNESLDQVMAAEVIRLLGDKSDALRSLALEDRAALRSGVEQFLDEQVEANPQDAEMVALRDDIRDKYARVDKLKADGYAPLMRFGRYKVHIVDPSSDQTMFFGLYESAADANRAARELMEDPEMQGFRVEQGVLAEKQYEMFAAMPMDSLEMFAEALGAQESEVFKEYIRLAKNNRSALKRLLKRKGTAGYSTDARRVLAAFVTSNARLAAGALNLPGAKEAALNIRDGDVQDEAIGLIQSIQNPQGGAAWARGLMFVNFIGGSVASALVNVTQPLTMTLPWLSQWGGMTKAGKRLMEAGKIASTGKGMDAELAAALKRAEDDGIVSPQEIHYLQSQAMGKMGGRPILQRAAFIWAAPFTMAEQFNRRTSFIAAYLTAKQEGMGEAAFDFAQRAVVETQGLYNPGNQANWARNPVGAAVLTFKQFSVHYLEWMRRMWSAGTPGSAERKAGRKAVLYAMAILILAAGTEGLPFADDLDDLIDTIGQALGYDTNSKRFRRNLVANTLGMGDQAADVFGRGFSALAGVPFDVSLRMSMGNLVPGTGMLLRSNVDKSREVLELAGPAGGLIDQYTKAGQKALQGDAAGAALQAMPVAIQNVGKAVGMWTTGEARDSKDRRIMDADTMDGLMRFLGFNPQSIARESDKMGMLRRSEQLAKNVEGEIAADWARAQADGDREGVQEAKQRLRDWNEKNPSAKIEISGPQILRRVIQLRKDRAARFITSTSPERRREVSEALQ